MHTAFLQLSNPLRDRIEDVDIPHHSKHISFRILKRGTKLVSLQMAARLHQGLQHMSTDTFFWDMADAFVRKSRALRGTNRGGHGTMSGPDIVAILDHLGGQIGTGKKGHTLEEEVGR